MLSYDKQRQLIIVCILGIILTVILAVVALVLIWKPTPVKEKVYKVGEVEMVTLNSDDLLNEYYIRLKTKFENSDIDGLADLVSPDYYTYTGKTREDVKTMLTDSDLLGKSLSLENGVLYSIEGYNNVYALTLKSDGEVYSINIVVREYAPEQYTISFDNFIDYREQVYAGTANSVELRITKMARYTTSMTCKFRITNNYKDTITLNADKENGAVPFVSSMTEAVKYASMCTIANQSLEIPSGMAREIEATYNMTNLTDYMTYNVFVLNGAVFNGTDGEVALEYYLY